MIYDDKEKMLALNESRIFVNELQDVLEHIEICLNSYEENKQANGVIHSTAIMQCLSQYPAKAQEIFERIQAMEKQSTLN